MTAESPLPGRLSPDAVTSFEEIAAEFGVLPEALGPADLEVLNQALISLFGRLREASALYPTGQNGGRAGVVRALGAVCFFLMRFNPALLEGLHIPLLNLESALLALNGNNVEPMLKPTVAPSGGRALDSPARQALVGVAVGAVRRLKWTGLKSAAARNAVADALTRVGIKPARGKRRITERTIRDWCERVDADVGRRSVAAMNADAVCTDEWRLRILALEPGEARRFILMALTNAAVTSPITTSECPDHGW
jgi:hypothetical protein